MLELLIGVVAFFVLGLLAFRSADKYGPKVTLTPKPIDEAFIQAKVHPFRPGPHGFKAGLMQPTRDDATVENLSQRRRG